jgi:hypothetical protein
VLGELVRHGLAARRHRLGDVARALGRGGELAHHSTDPRDRHLRRGDAEHVQAGVLARRPAIGARQLDRVGHARDHEVGERIPQTLALRRQRVELGRDRQGQALVEPGERLGGQDVAQLLSGLGDRQHARHVGELFDHRLVPKLGHERRARRAPRLELAEGGVRRGDGGRPQARPEARGPVGIGDGAALEIAIESREQVAIDPGGDLGPARHDRAARDLPQPLLRSARVDEQVLERPAENAQRVEATRRPRHAQARAHCRERVVRERLRARQAAGALDIVHQLRELAVRQVEQPLADRGELGENGVHSACCFKASSRRTTSKSIWPVFQS